MPLQSRWAVGFARIVKRRVLRRDAAVDEADDDAITVQPLNAAQPLFAIEQLEKSRAVTSGERADLVFPDVQDFGQVFEFLCLRRRHARGETVDAVLVAVDRLCIRPDPGQHALLGLDQARCILFDCGTAAIDTGAWLAGACRGGARDPRVLFGGRRRA